MNKKYHFQFQGRYGKPITGWVILIFAAAAVLFFNFVTTNLGLFTILLIAAGLAANFVDAKNAYIEISDGKLSFIRMFQKKWQVPIQQIKSVTVSPDGSGYFGMVKGTSVPAVVVDVVADSFYEAKVKFGILPYQQLNEDLQKLNPNIQLTTKL